MTKNGASQQRDTTFSDIQLTAICAWNKVARPARCQGTVRAQRSGAGPSPQGASLSSLRGARSQAVVQRAVSQQCLQVVVCCCSHRMSDGQQGADLGLQAVAHFLQPVYAGQQVLRKGASQPRSSSSRPPLVVVMLMVVVVLLVVVVVVGCSDGRNGSHAPKQMAACAARRRSGQAAGSYQRSSRKLTIGSQGNVVNCQRSEDRVDLQQQSPLQQQKGTGVVPRSTNQRGILQQGRSNRVRMTRQLHVVCWT